jgi:transcriptional regulator with XRE-family HTH domain
VQDRSDGGGRRTEQAKSRVKVQTAHGGSESPSARLAAAQKAIGNFLRATRASQRLTQQQVATLTRKSPWQLSRAAISAIERGQNFPGMEAMLALSHVLYIDPKELVERARMSTVVPVDVTGMTYEDLEHRAEHYFWAGDFRQALSVYDAILEKIALEGGIEDEASARRIARLEIRRATALKRAGALLSAISTAERAIALGALYPDIQADAYVVLADLQCHRGHLPLASDAARRAVELAPRAGPQTRGWAHIVDGRVRFLSGRFEEARAAFLDARRCADESGDRQHLTHIDGNVGVCWMHLGDLTRAREWLDRALGHARENTQPALEASWLVEIGKVALASGDPTEADRLALAALRIARPREHSLTVFRAEWLRHRVVERTAGAADGPRLETLRKLLLQLDQHEGIEEIQEFKQSLLRARSGGGGGTMSIEETK